MKNFDTEKTYDNVMNRYKWGGMERKGLYVDETVMRMCYTHRHLMADLALQLIAEGKNDKALNVLRKSEKVLPDYNVPNNYISGAADLAKAYALLGKKADAQRIINQVWADSKQYAKWYVGLDGSLFAMSQNEALKYIYIMQATSDVENIISESKARAMMKEIDAVYSLYRVKGGRSFDSSAE